MRVVLRLLINIVLTGMSKSITQIRALKYFKLQQSRPHSKSLDESNFTNSGLAITDDITYKNYHYNALAKFI
jgi:hypothetical protein